VPHERICQAERHHPAADQPLLVHDYWKIERLCATTLPVEGILDRPEAARAGT